MGRERKRTATPKRPAKWQPLILCAPADPEKYEPHGLTVPDSCWKNNVYSVFVREMRHGALHISYHRHDRAPVRDWRHGQAIKNEVAGPERLAIEIYPPESNLVDTSNEYHLFVLPAGVEATFPFLWKDGKLVMSPAEMEEHLGGPTKARQREWEEGIPTGLGVAAA